MIVKESLNAEVYTPQTGTDFESSLTVRTNFKTYSAHAVSQWHPQPKDILRRQLRKLIMAQIEEDIFGKEDQRV